MESSERLMTVKELASRLSMSVPWVYKACEHGALPYHRIGEALRFDPGEIKQYLDERKNLKKGDKL